MIKHTENKPVFAKFLTDLKFKYSDEAITTAIDECCGYVKLSKLEA